MSGFRKMQQISCLAEDMLVSHEEHCSVALVSELLPSRPPTSEYIIVHPCAVHVGHLGSGNI